MRLLTALRFSTTLNAEWPPFRGNPALQWTGHHNPRPPNTATLELYQCAY